MSAGPVVKLTLKTEVIEFGAAHAAPKPAVDIGTVVLENQELFDDLMSGKKSPVMLKDEASLNAGRSGYERASFGPICAPEDMLRTWIVRCRVELAGKPMPFGLIAKDVTIESEIPDVLEVKELFSSPDQMVSTFVVNEIKPFSLPDCLLRKSCFTLSLVPKYQPEMADSYRLDKKLVDLVGGLYVANSKVALCKVAEYAESHKLRYFNYLLSDSYLHSILGVDLLECQDLWERLKPLVFSVPEKALEQDVCLMGNAFTVKTMDLKMDENGFFLPHDWVNLDEQPTAFNMYSNLDDIYKADKRHTKRRVPLKEYAPVDRSQPERRRSGAMRLNLSALVVLRKRMQAAEKRAELKAQEQALAAGQSAFPKSSYMTPVSRRSRRCVTLNRRLRPRGDLFAIRLGKTF